MWFGGFVVECISSSCIKSTSISVCMTLTCRLLWFCAFHGIYERPHCSIWLLQEAPAVPPGPLLTRSHQSLSTVPQSRESPLRPRVVPTTPGTRPLWDCITRTLLSWHSLTTHADCHIWISLPPSWHMSSWYHVGHQKTKAGCHKLSCQYNVKWQTWIGDISIPL